MIAKDTDYIIEAFKLLIENHISAVPVLDTEKGEYHFFVDLSDILAHAVDILTENEIKEGFDPEISQIEFSRYTVAQLAGYSHTNRFVEISEEATLKDALQVLIEQGVRRLVLKNKESGELVSLLTQSQVVAVLHPFIKDFSFATMTVGDLKLGYRQTGSVSLTMPTKDAFKKLHSARFDGLAVTDEKDALVGNISVSDLSLIGYDGSMFKRLMWPLSKFLEGRLAKPNSHKAKHGLAGILSVSPQDTIQAVFDKFHQTEVHRLYIEQNGKLLGVILLLDLLRLVCEASGVSNPNAARRQSLSLGSSGLLQLQQQQASRSPPKDNGSSPIAASPSSSSASSSHSKKRSGDSDQDIYEHRSPTSSSSGKSKRKSTSKKSE